MEVYDDDAAGPRREGLYVAGTMTTAGSASALGIARWDGQSWEGLAGPGQNPGITGTPVEALCKFDPDGPGPQREGLYVGGFYSHAGGIEVWGLARWDGVWSAVPGWTGGGVQAMAVFDDDGPGPNKPALFVGGGISQVGPQAASGIVKWDGQQWSILDGGVTGFGAGTSIRAMAVYDEDGPGPNPGGLYAGGYFFNAASGQLYSPGLARWGCPPPPVCYPNCTNDYRATGQPNLTVSDFGCFQTRYVLGDPYADCTQDGALTVADFGCFQTRFVTGCP